jgi:uncharacterized protein
MSEPAHRTNPHHPGPESPPPQPDPSLLQEPPHPPAWAPPAMPRGGGPGEPPRSGPGGWPPSPAYPPDIVDAADRNWAVAAHLSGFVAAWVALGFLGPLVVLLTEGQRRPFVRRHAVEALNFNLSVLIYSVVSAVLVLVVVGLVMLAVLGVLYLVATVLGAVAASRGQGFRYPMTIRFVS